MKRLWDEKVPVVTLILLAIVDITAFMAASESSRFRYWPRTTGS